MSQNIRAVPWVSARQGSTWKVDGSGRASMSASYTRAKPSIAEPSNPMPSAKAASSSAGATATDLRKPKDIGEPEPDEADVALLERAEDELLLLVHGASLTESGYERISALRLLRGPTTSRGDRRRRRRRHGRRTPCL